MALIRTWVCLWCGLAAIGCSASSGGLTGPSGGSGDGGGNAAGGSGNGGGFPGSGGDGQGGGFIPGGGSGTGGSSTSPDGGCVGTASRAEPLRGGEADIIWVIDNSGSMFDEAVAVQENMNRFSTFITNTGIDVRVVVVSSTSNFILPPYGVCLAPPLGSGMCPNDSTYPNGNYLHIIREVDSHNSLGMLQETYPQWEPILRSTATKTFVVVTDDEAHAVPGAQGFTDWVNAQAKFQGNVWRFSGIFCLPGQAAGFNCFGTGHIYQDLVQRSGGVASHIGSPDWSTIFQQLADAVVADVVPVECEWVIPQPPEGETLDPALVNVQFTRGTGVTETIFGVEGTPQCTEDFLGWHYDNNDAPTRVIACPQTCPILQADNQAAIEVQFGCDRKPPPDVH